MRRLIALPMVAVLLVGGVAAAAPATGATTTVTCPTGWGSLPEDRAAPDSRSLVNVRTGAHPCFDRIVLDVPGSSAAHPVSYHVRYVDTLYQDGSGQPIPMRGGALIEIVAEAPSYDVNTGAATYPGRAGQPLPGVDLTGYRTFVEAKFASSFEGDTQLGLGVRARLPFQVFQLDNRLVIDVAHSWTATA
ncbi:MULTISPECIES: hypothetical protein [unclassified Kitasatospora]|uniref:AMIN-like domain-containing (lipo)protein n=1 Tax=unclassified Kitasatospora TaxID=2633591 RepID=UPI00070E959D|nr:MULTISPECIES: hypothetical protein [unclassified Kitasatospora]KQV09919.1 hypothetical protein ASC99_10970 [Kitasatospora sp. Root107]KRB70159.1 hypothetical protein ASE03_26325 [Kitasatospora sp. Root187]